MIQELEKHQRMISLCQEQQTLKEELEENCRLQLSKMEAEAADMQVVLRATAADRDKRQSQLEMLLATTHEWEKRVEQSDAEYQEICAALATERHKSSQLQNELIALHNHTVLHPRSYGGGMPTYQYLKRR